MGDVASTFLGYSFAVMPLLASDQEGDALMLGTLLLWTFIMDAGVTFIRRTLRRENVFAAHRTHLEPAAVTDVQRETLLRRDALQHPHPRGEVCEAQVVVAAQALGQEAEAERARPDDHGPGPPHQSAPSMNRAGFA